jgi:hypothetical protein
MRAHMNEKPHSAEPKPGALERELRAVLRVKHYSVKTEESYVEWYRSIHDTGARKNRDKI